ncbi:ubiquitin carboxyl-terminal hydrolase 4 isoform X2 [Falco biarmicus]|uniref:ubiquitin carboxyl-terminal hydrolase 4 isoform X2 n=1 Tax=Falco cherrug TaxID=345164 RepID=UPI002478537C|nr:ubiquitin carboxyl-terminal hydrolase 4 isoform X2 [Falco cherrug]XP_056190954.1 ubiquitin carboxyl-terminal hydrolase 4 isoform X2 [Falco biarmicus]
MRTRADIRPRRGSRTDMAAAEGGSGGAGGARPDPTVQRAELGPLLAMALRPGESWYLVDSRWFKQWKKYVGFDSWDMFGVGDPGFFPGPIDNSGLFSDPETQSLKEHLIDELDYVLVPTEAWNKLVAWYGCVDGQQPIVRKVVEYGLFVKHYKVEVYLLELKLCESSNPDNVISCHFSKADTVATIEKEMRKLFNIPAEKETRLWNRYMSNMYEQLSKLDSTVQDAGLYQGQVVLIEVKNEDGTCPGQHFLAKGSGFVCNSYSCRDSASLTQPGLCGLSNLGNTCFMNSALQCLSNTPPLTDYFLEDKYEAEINQNNPLGMRGEIAEAYAELIKQIWSGRQSYVAPRMFKTQVGQFAPQFSGYQQQDSQELLAFLLDGLHEDLNRVKKKPYLELKDANGRPDSEVAKEAWENHRLRNDSIIVDIFHGLFKSTLVCPKCSKVSVTFDPFCYLTLPLPLRRDRPMEVTLVYAAPQRRPVQYRVVVPMMGAISDLCDSLSKLSGVPAENMVVTDVYNHRFHKIFQMDEGLNHIMPKDDIFVYEVCKPSEDGSECVTLSVYFREKTMRQSSNTSGTVLFGQPLLISVLKHKLTVDHLYSVVLEQISRYVKPPLAEEYSTTCPDKGTCNGSNGVVEGDIEEMEHQDSGQEGKEKLAEVDPCHCEGYMQVDSARDLQPCKKQHFTFSLVNSSGTSEINSIVEGKILKLNAFSALAIDWDSDTRRLLFDEQEAQAFEKHGSMLQPQKKKAVVALRDCIELFTTMETLGEHDPWYCPNCKKHQQATKKFDLWSLPRILVVHLKRFSYSRYWRDKLDTVVEFPIRGLNMSEFVCDPRAGSYVYDLIAVSNHYGAMGVGHYTAYAKNKVDGKWYYFDDSSVLLASEDQIVTKAAYVLFYQRRNSEEHTAPSPPQEECDGMDTN